MQVVILANDVLKDEWLFSVAAGNNVEWIKDVTAFKDYPDADAYIDLEFEPAAERIQILKNLLPKPVIINSVINTLAEAGFAAVRINAWPTFLKREITEACCADDAIKNRIEEIFNALGKKIEWTPDVPGFITLRVIAMIINEAYFALADGVSTKEEIDTAMKLGANYPYGPFKWSKKIGLKNIYELLAALSKENNRYEPAPQLKAEAR